MANKIKYGLKNVYYAAVTDSGYATPVAIPGAVSLSLDAQGDINKFYADNTVYFQTVSNNGYDGTLEMALIPDSFREAVLGEVTDQNGLLIESVDSVNTPFALLFQFEGDDKARRHVLYNCTATRPSLASATTEDSREPQTETLNISAVANEDGYVKASVDAGESKYSTWFSQVVLPTE